MRRSILDFYFGNEQIRLGKEQNSAIVTSHTQRHKANDLSILPFVCGKLHILFLESTHVSMLYYSRTWLYIGRLPYVEHWFFLGLIEVLAP